MSRSHTYAIYSNTIYLKEYLAVLVYLAKGSSARNGYKVARMGRHLDESFERRQNLPSYNIKEKAQELIINSAHVDNDNNNCYY